jgi:hypothetical protein
LISTLEINPAPEDKRALAIISAKLECARLEDDEPSELFEAHDLLAEMVNQHCADLQDHRRKTTFALRPNEDAIFYLEKLGWLKKLSGPLDRWIWTKKAFKE